VEGVPEQKQTGGGLSISTLLISAVSAVAAATIVPMIWERGTLVATAMTPVIVALVSEALKKPVQTVSAVAPKVATRRSGTGAAVRRFDPDAAQTRHHERIGARGQGAERFEPLPAGRRDDAPATRSDDPYGLRAADKPPRRHWKIAVITGLLAFVIAAGFITFTELAAGGSVSSDRRTSIFGGRDTATSNDSTKDSKRDATPTPTATPDEQQTATPTATATPEASATPTPTASAEATPAPTETPAVPTPTP
jgi:hypothetical protein